MIIAQCCNTLTPPPPPVVEGGTNGNNVLIATIICVSLVLLALITAITLSVWHKKEIAKSQREAEKNRQNEKEDRGLKLKNEYQVHLLEYVKEQLKQGTYKDDNEYVRRIGEIIDKL